MAAALGVVVTLGAGTWTAGAQLPPITLVQGQPPITLFPPPPPPPTTPTTEAPSTTEPPASTDTSGPPDDGSTPAEPGAGGEGGAGEVPTDPTAVPVGDEAPPADGDGELTPLGALIPPDAQQVISSIARTAPADNDALVAGAAALEAAGVPHDEAVRLVFGAFPILGPARWVDDWYMPRWTGTLFRHHLGLDMVAALGTPVAAPADGVARIASSALGGLTVRVVEADGTFWYLAHLSGVAEGLVDGAPVTVGQVVGFVGDSGNARGGVPHLHFAVHPGGGAAVPPKPIVDEWVVDGAARVPELLAGAVFTPQSAAAVSTSLTRDLASGTNPADSLAPVGPARSELLWATGANPAGGAVRLAEAAAAAVTESVDWDQRAVQQSALDAAWSHSTAAATRVLGPLTASALRHALDARRTAV